MTLAQRVRDGRYAMGWGPDELASRASISRTALYQIESGKTEQPRAGTIRRIAEALSVPTESLLGQGAPGLGTVSVPLGPGDNGPFALTRPLGEAAGDEAVRFASLGASSFVANGWGLPSREHEVAQKFQELLQSPLGEGLARIVEESYRLLPSRAEAAH